MQILPIVERELRGLARQPKTWWRRVLTLGVALVVFGFLYLELRRWASANRIGRELFDVLSGFSMVYALLSGPLATVDCLGRERRDGTLGLLFLTDLRSYDVVLGKMAAASFDMVLGLAAVLPLMALPLLLGGVSYLQFAYTILMLGSILLLSLAVGACASSLCLSGRAALGVTVGALCFLTLGLPWLGEEVLKIRFQSKVGALFYMACPLHGLILCLEMPLRFSQGKYWLNVGGLHGLAWGCLIVACLRTRRIWRDLPVSELGRWWSMRWERWRRGTAASRQAWRRLMLQAHPVSWLEGRDRLQGRVLASLLLLNAGFWTFKHNQAPNSWPDGDLLILWPLFAHYVLCLWMALQAPRRLADDKQSGALELLLCTPIKPTEIVGGAMRILRRRFGRALLALMFVDGFIVFAYFNVRGGWNAFERHDAFPLALWALIVFPLQAYCFARVGLYQGLAQSNSLRATFMVVWKVGLLPWVIFVVSILTLELGRQQFRMLPRITDELAFSTWAGAHVLTCVLWLAQANWQLRWRFRALAAQTTTPAWWQRWSRLVRS